MPLTPNNREEHWLKGMVDGQTTLEPNKRREYWYKEIVDAIGSGGGGGTGGGVLVVTVDPQTETLDKTWQEIVDASFPVFRIQIGSYTVIYYFVGYEYDDYGYYLDLMDIRTQTTHNFVAESADGYPVIQK